MIKGSLLSSFPIVICKAFSGQKFFQNGPSKIEVFDGLEGETFNI